MVEKQILQPHTYHCCRCTCHVQNNITTQKGVVNGAIATITSIIFDLKNNTIAIEIQPTTNSMKMISKKKNISTQI